MQDIPVPILIVFGVIGVIVGPWLAFKGLGLLGKGTMHVLRFVGGEISDAARIVGSLVTALVFVPLVLVNVLIGRWSASAHYGRAITAEGAAIGASLYRIAIGHPARLLGLSAAVEGLEQRVPQVMAAAPTRDTPKKRVGAFEGYTIIGSLAGGGSGGKLYVAEPTPEKHAALKRSGHQDVDQVVIKTFSLDDGSSLPQIVRENRALSAAKKMGLVLEHDLTPDRFFYVMRYVPGKPLGQVAAELHARSQGELNQRDVRTVVGYVADLTRTLHAYHQGGLWHKDVKPDNIIVDGTSAHLVDFGLITPLRSAMTLTTHGTEYFRDPEMVRMALRGAKVHEVNGAKFDVYAAGAVLYAVIENSFPAHGALSQLSKKCPDTLKWIIRRAMTDYDKRYASARDMLADLEFVLAAENIDLLKPAELPSFKGGSQHGVPAVPFAEPLPIADEPLVMAAAHTPRPPHNAFGKQAFGHGGSFGANGGFEPAASPVGAGAHGKSGKPRISLLNWWTGAIAVEQLEQGVAPQPVRVARNGNDARKAQAARVAGFGPAVSTTPFGKRMAARDQLRNARNRAHNRRKSATSRIASKRNAHGRFSKDANAGVGVAVLLGLGLLVGFFISSMRDASDRDRSTEVVENNDRGPSVIVVTPSGSAVSSANAATSAASVPTEPVFAGERVLVLSDALPPFAPKLAGEIEAAFKHFDALGLETISTMSVDALPANDDELAMLAEVSHQRAQMPLESDQLQAVLDAWLARQSNIAGIAWLNTDGQLFLYTKGHSAQTTLVGAPARLTELLVNSASGSPSPESQVSGQRDPNQSPLEPEPSLPPKRPQPPQPPMPQLH
jgi:serine/threonine protein kinase